MKDFVTFPGPSTSLVYLNGFAACRIDARHEDEVGEPGHNCIEIRRCDEIGWHISCDTPLIRNGEITVRRLNADGTWHSVIRINRDGGGPAVSIGYSTHNIGFLEYREIGHIESGSHSTGHHKRLYPNYLRHLSTPETSELNPRFKYNATGISETIELTREGALLFCERHTLDINRAFGIIGCYQKWPLIRLGLASFVMLPNSLNIAIHGSYKNETGVLNTQNFGILSIPKEPDLPIEVYDSQAYFLCSANLNSCKRIVTFNSGRERWHARI